MPNENHIAGLQVFVAVLNFGCLVLNLKLTACMFELRTEVLKMFAEHVREYHPAAHQARAPR